MTGPNQLPDPGQNPDLAAAQAALADFANQYGVLPGAPPPSGDPNQAPPAGTDPNQQPDPNQTNTTNNPQGDPNMSNPNQPAPVPPQPGNTPPAPAQPNVPPAPAQPNTPPAPAEPEERVAQDESEALRAAREDAIANQLANLPDHVDVFKTKRETRLNEAITEATNKRSASTDATEQQALDQKIADLQQELADHQGRSDDEHASIVLGIRVRKARSKYAQELANRRDSNVAIKSGRKQDVGGAQFEWEVACGVVTRHENPGKSEKEINEAHLIFMLGEPGEDLATNKGDAFKLTREEARQRKLRSGRYVEGDTRNADGMPEVVEKEAANWIVQKARAVQDKWNQWSEEARANKWYSWKAVKARGKQVVSAAVVGTAAGLAAKALLTTGAALAVGVGVSRLAKGAGAAKLNKGANVATADQNAMDAAINLAEAREYYEQALNEDRKMADGRDFDMFSAIHNTANDEFTNPANASHRGNLIRTGVTTGSALLGGFIAGQAANEALFGGNGNDHVEAHPAGTNQPNTGANQPSGSQQPSPNQQPSGTTQPETGRVGGAAQQGSASEQPESAQSHPDQKPNGNGQQPNQNGNTPNQPASPNTGNTPGEVKTVTPDQMRDQWVSEVYHNQLGNGSFQEMLHNAQDAADAGEIEKIDNVTDKPIPFGKKTSNFYYRLTEKGAAKFPGAKSGSTQTVDIMRVLASHSSKIKVAA